MTTSAAPHVPGPTSPNGPNGPHAQGVPPRRGSTLPWVLVAVLAVVALVLGGLLAFGPGGSDATAQRGFGTPEEAIKFSTQQVADGDATAALSAWAGDAQAQNLDLVGTLERLGAITPFDTASLPSDDEFFVGLAQAARAGTAAEQYRRLTVSLLLPDLSIDTTTRLGDGDVTAQDIADGLDSSRLSGLQAQSVDQVVGPEMYDERLAEAATLVGADERREYVVLYELDGETYLGGVGVLRYGDDWQIDSLVATLAGTANGSLEPTTAAEYDDLVAGFSAS